jgi:hypothetical protein
LEARLSAEIITTIASALVALVAFWRMLEYFDKRNVVRFESLEKKIDALNDALKKELDNMKEALWAELRNMESELRVEIRLTKRLSAKRLHLN